MRISDITLIDRSRAQRRWAGVAAFAAALVVSLGPPAQAQTLLEGSEQLNSVLWMQKAPEYAFNAEQTYRAATARLKAVRRGGDALVPAEATSKPSSRQPAIILDLDETVLDNTPFQAGMALGGRFYTNEAWDAWSVRRSAGLVPGAKAFLQEAQRQGFRIFYVTNRECPVATAPNAYPHRACQAREETAAVLRKWGLPFADDPAALMLRYDQSDWLNKGVRRMAIARRHRVAMLIGDDLGDFLPDAEESALHAAVQPGQLVSGLAAENPSNYQRYAAHFGRDWFVLPNPAYGSWERALGSRLACTGASPPLSPEACYRAALARKRTLLTPAP